MGDYLIKRGGMWSFYRRVPKEYAGVDRRKFVFESTKIKIADDRRAMRALQVAERINGALIQYWESLMRGEAAAAKATYDDACRRARALGYRYREAGELASDQPDLLKRIDELEKIIGRMAGQPPATIEPTVNALLGGVARVTVPLSGLFDAFYEINAVNLKRKSKHQIEKWKDVRKRAATNFLHHIGDKDISAVTRADAISFRKWWNDRILGEELSPSTANVDLAYVPKMLREVARHHDLDLPELFARITFKKNPIQRVAYSLEFIRDKLLAPGAFDGLNPEARRAVFVMIETGLRPSELVNLDETMIRLNAKIPHLTLKAGGRELKNGNSERDLPLVGVAFAAMRLQPKGFVSYGRDDSERLCEEVNLYLTEAGLRETPDHTFYSIRHAYKDRLREANIETELKDMLMGHSHNKERYGNGFTLARKLEALQKIAFEKFPKNP